MCYQVYQKSKVIEILMLLVFHIAYHYALTECNYGSEAFTEILMNKLYLFFSFILLRSRITSGLENKDHAESGTRFSLSVAQE